jgi:hypothetical protein
VTTWLLLDVRNASRRCLEIEGEVKMEVELEGWWSGEYDDCEYGYERRFIVLI